MSSDRTYLPLLPPNTMPTIMEDDMETTIEKKDGLLEEHKDNEMLNRVGDNDDNDNK
jgi:hypothetical protein